LFSTTYNTAGTAKVRGSRAKPQDLWVGLWVEIHGASQRNAFMEYRSVIAYMISKRTSAPKIERSFHSACADLNPQKRFYVYPGIERFPLDGRTEAISVIELAKNLQAV
jgi:hypothetical protein